MTATRTPYPPDTDRFFGTANAPAPPENPPGRRRYWDDAVTEAIGELRRRLRSSREELVTHALFAILDLEKHKLRHGRPISGTHVPYLGDLDERPSSLTLQSRAEPPKLLGPTLESQAKSVTGIVSIDQVSITSTPAIATTVEPPRADRPRSCVGRTATPPPNTPPPSPDERPSSLTLQSRAEPPKLHGPIRENQATGVVAPSAATSPPAVPWYDDPTHPRYLARVDRDREAYIEGFGRYPEDDFPNNPDYVRFKSEPRPHPAFLRWLVRVLGTGDDSLPIGIT